MVWAGCVVAERCRGIFENEPDAERPAPHIPRLT